MISLNVASRKEVGTLIERVEANGGPIADCSTDAHGFYGASFTGLDGHCFNVIVR
ncbi:TPA: hypothetical protein ACHU8D_000513 [Streptococcus suis]